MPKARSKKLLVLAIACTTLTTALVAAWGVSVFRFAGYISGLRHYALAEGTFLTRGAVYVSWRSEQWTAGTARVTVWQARPPRDPLIWLPAIELGPIRRIVTIPMWMPVSVSLLATYTAWRYTLRSRRRARAGLCPTCRYDLAATPAGAPCPECGTPTSPAVAAIAVAAAGSRENAE